MIVGVDFDTYKATMVGLPLQGWGRPVLEEVVFRKKAGDDEAYAALARSRSLLSACELCYLGDVFFIERGWGANRKSDYLMGAFFGVIFSYLSGHSPTNVINAQEWKKAISAACGVTTKDGTPGRGDLMKWEAHEYLHVVASQQKHNLSNYTVDALDAYAIATTGRWLNDAAASAIMGGVNDERNSGTPVEDAALRGAAGGVAATIPEGGA